MNICIYIFTLQLILVSLHFSMQAHLKERTIKNFVDSDFSMCATLKGMSKLKNPTEIDMIAYFHPHENEYIDLKKVDVAIKAEATGQRAGFYVSDPFVDEFIKERITTSHVYQNSETYIDPFIDSKTVYMDLRAPLPPDMRKEKENSDDYNMFCIGVTPIKKGHRYKIREAAYDLAVRKIKGL